MSEPRRLVDEGGPGAWLLASAQGDAPTARARAGTAAALGVAAVCVTHGASAGAGAATGAAAISGGAGKTIGVGASAGAASGLAAKVGGTSLAAKVALGLALSTTVSAALLAGALRDDPSAAEQGVVRSEGGAMRPSVVARSIASRARGAARALPSSSAPAAPAPGTAEVQGPGPRSLPPTSRSTSRSLPVAQGALPRARPEDLTGPTVLAREVAAVDRARAALLRGDARTALVLLDDHDRSFGAPMLAPEASALRALALSASGDRARAAELARDILSREPASPHAARLRAIAQASP